MSTWTHQTGAYSWDPGLALPGLSDGITQHQVFHLAHELCGGLVSVSCFADRGAGIPARGRRSGGTAGTVRAAERGHATPHPGLLRGSSPAPNTPAMTHGRPRAAGPWAAGTASASRSETAASAPTLRPSPHGCPSQRNSTREGPRPLLWHRRSYGTICARRNSPADGEWWMISPLARSRLAM